MFLAGAIWALMWAVKTNQFDDLVGPAHRIVLDDREARRDQLERIRTTEQQSTEQKDDE
jgi:cbb3-type cytochrome oxidase maturation protein